MAFPVKPAVICPSFYSLVLFEFKEFYLFFLFYLAAKKIFLNCEVYFIK